MKLGVYTAAPGPVGAEINAGGLLPSGYRCSFVRS